MNVAVSSAFTILDIVRLQNQALQRSMNVGLEAQTHAPPHGHGRGDGRFPREHQADHQPLTPRYVNTRRHNLQHSVFYRLPNAVIARLMVMLDPVSLQCLRRTGHIFFQAFEQTFMLPLPEAQDWPFPKPPLPFLKTITDAECQALISILRRDELCLDCREARGQPNWPWRVQQTTQKYLHCSGCRRDHPVLLFTPAQRRFEPRLCVGHTGHIRLCEHEVVKWTQIVAAARKMKKKMGRVVIAECKKKSHFRPCQHHRLGAFWERFGHDNYTPQLCPENPRLLLYLSETDTLMVKLDWSPHLDIRPIKASAYPAGKMNQMLSSLRQQQARYICPQVQPGQSLESGIFDPSLCACFPSHKIEPLYSACGQSLKTPIIEFRICDTVSVGAHKRLEPIMKVLEKPVNGAHQIPRPFFRRKHWVRPVYQNVADSARHRASQLSTPARGGMTHLMKTIVRPCKWGGECLQVDFSWIINLGPPEKGGGVRRMGSTWFQALDYTSFQETQDSVGFGLYWCTDWSCRNHWTYTRSRLRPFVEAGDYSIRCEWYGGCKESELA